MGGAIYKAKGMGEPTYGLLQVIQDHSGLRLSEAYLCCYVYIHMHKHARLG